MDNHLVRVLLVDDDEDDYILTRDLLSESQGIRFELEWIAACDPALEAIAHNKYDVYLLDYRLGEHNGLQLRLHLDPRPDSEDEPGNTISSRLRSLRSQYGISQGELARALGTSLAALAKWERGVGEPSPSIAAEIAALSAGEPLTRLRAQADAIPSRGAQRSWKTRQRHGTAGGRCARCDMRPRPTLRPHGAPPRHRHRLLPCG